MNIRVKTFFAPGDVQEHLERMDMVWEDAIKYLSEEDRTTLLFGSFGRFEVRNRPMRQILSLLEGMKVLSHQSVMMIEENLIYKNSPVVPQEPRLGNWNHNYDYFVRRVNERTVSHSIPMNSLGYSPDRRRAEGYSECDGFATPTLFIRWARVWIDLWRKDHTPCDEWKGDRLHIRMQYEYCVPIFI